MQKIKKIKTTSFSYLGHNLEVVFAVVLVWRGIWELLDFLDDTLFGGNYLWTTVGGIFLGLFILYWPDKDLKELG